MRRILLVLAAISVLVLVTSVPSHALEKCKAVLKTKDGTIEVKARDVQGALTWGDEAGLETNVFSNAATCVVGSKARKCVLGPPGSLERITRSPGGLKSTRPCYT